MLWPHDKGFLKALQASLLSVIKALETKKGEKREQHCCLGGLCCVCILSEGFNRGWVAGERVWPATLFTLLLYQPRCWRFRLIHIYLGVILDERVLKRVRNVREWVRNPSRDQKQKWEHNLDLNYPKACPSWHIIASIHYIHHQSLDYIYF